MDSFVRRGRGLLHRRQATSGRPGETVLELGDSDSVEVRVLEGDPRADGVPAPGPDASDPDAPDPDAPELKAQLWPPSAKHVRLAALVAIIVLAVSVSVLAVRRSQDPTIDELRHQAGWSDLHALKVGVSGDVPYLSDCVSKPPECSGFDIQIARLVASWLGVRRSEIEFDRVLPEDRERMLGRSFVTGNLVRVDLVVAAFSITPERTDDHKVVFAGPYLNTQTTVLTRKDHPPVESLAALSDPITVKGRPTQQKVCTHGTTTSRNYLRRESTAAVVLRALNSECVQLLRAGEVDAAVTDAAILAGFQATYPGELRMNNIASTDDEHWGIGLGQDFTGHDAKIQARRKLVVLALDDLLTAPGQDGWKDAFDLLPPTQQTPGADVQVVADDQQPTPWDVPKVRRWPWEHSGNGSGR
jgi:glutamate transport system substrate-binding protein